MNLIPKIRQGEEITLEKLNALIGKINDIEISKRDLEYLRDNIRADIEKNNAILEGIRASQNVVQQIAHSDSLETITNLLMQFMSVQTQPYQECPQRLGIKEGSEEGSIAIYIETKNADGYWQPSTEFILKQGTIGATGAQGPQGIQGPPGPKGEIGPRGFRGITGKNGDSADIQMEYVNSVINLSELPNDTHQYLRIQVKHINADGVESITDTRYIPTHGYIYVPEIYRVGQEEDSPTYIRFKKVVNTGITASSIIDDGINITGPRGPQGIQGPPGTGIACSNVITLTSGHLLQRTSTPQDLEEALRNSATSESQDQLITEIVAQYPDNNSYTFGLLSLGTDDSTSSKYTFIKKTDNGWALLRDTIFPLAADNSVDLHALSTTQPTLEIPITQEILYGNTVYHKLLVGSGFVCPHEVDSILGTSIYVINERANIHELKADEDTSFYILTKSEINAGVSVPNLNTDTFTAKNIILPTDNSDIGRIICNYINSNQATFDHINLYRQNVFIYNEPIQLTLSDAGFWEENALDKGELFSPAITIAEDADCTSYSEYISLGTHICLGEVFSIAINTRIMFTNYDSEQIDIQASRLLLQDEGWYLIGTVTIDGQHYDTECILNNYLYTDTDDRRYEYVKLYI